MVRRAKNSYKYRRRRRFSIYIPIALIFTVAALVLGMSVFFKTANIEVSGIMNYSSEDVIAASGIAYGGNIFFVDEDEAINKIYAAMTYVDEIKIVKKYPDTIVITANECYRLAAIKDGASYWIINKNGKILEETDERGAQSAIMIKGISLEEPVVGSKMTITEENAVQFTYVTDILSAVVEYEMENDITEIDMTNIGGITFDYKNRFVVELGNGDNADIKLALMEKVADSLKETDTGRINIFSENEAHFIPD